MSEYDRELEELEQGLNGALTPTKEDRKRKPQKDSIPATPGLLLANRREAQHSAR